LAASAANCAFGSHRGVFHAHAKIYRQAAASVRLPGQNR
jgi:hypothetical protein